MDNTNNVAAFGVVACAICQIREAVWVHNLDPQLAQFSKFGKGHCWGSPLNVCDQCEQSLHAVDVEALVAADPTSSNLSGKDLDESIRNGLRALVAADLGAARIDASQPPEYRQLVDAGFTPLENITGALFLGEAWPESDRRELPFVSSEGAAGIPQDTHWFVRSPWPAITLSDVFQLVISTLDKSLRDMEPHYDEEQAKIPVRELLNSREEDIRHRLGM